MHVNIRIILTRSGQGKFEPETDHQSDENVLEVFEHSSVGQQHRYWVMSTQGSTFRLSTDNPWKHVCEAQIGCSQEAYQKIWWAGK